MTRHGAPEVAGLVAAGLAAFFAVTGLVPDSQILAQGGQPALSNPETLVLTAADASYLSPVTLTEVSGANIDEKETLTPNYGAGSPSVAVWTVTTSFTDATHNQQLEPASRTFAIDRATGQLVDCCGASIDGNLMITQTGLSGYMFPAGARKQAYDVFDTVLDRPEPAAYSGSGTIDGIPAYRYTEAVTAARAGFSPLSATDPELYSARDSFWVDPETGAVLAITAVEDLFLAGPAAPRLFDADLTTTDATVTHLADQDRGIRREITVASDLRLACLVLAGVLAAAAWYALSRRQPPPAPRHLRARKQQGKYGQQEITEAVPPGQSAALKMPSQRT
jgi:hypothetical protein